MKKKRLFFITLITFFWGSNSHVLAQTTLAQESFENASGDFGFTANFGGACSDLWDRVTTTPVCFADNLDATANGNAWIAGEDVDGTLGAGVEGLITLNAVNVSGFSSLQFRVAFGTSNNNGTRWEQTDNIYFEYNMDGGGWTIAALYQGDGAFGGELRVDTDNNPNTFGPYGSTAPDGSFQDETFSIPVTGSSLQVRIRADIDGGSEEIGFDNLRVIGTASPNVAPVIANIGATAITYNEGDPATQITNTITVSDADDVNLSSATVSIIAGLDASEDVLAFTATGGITGSYNAATGVLSLSGSSSLANYETVLRSVSYQNTDAADANPATRTLRFQVNDGTDGSNLLSKDINITTAVNGPVALPICESFETSGEGTRYTSNTFDLGSGGANCDFFFRTNTQPACHNDPISGVDGSFFWASEDVRAGNGNVPGTVQLSPLIATGLNDFTIEVLLGASNNAGGIRFEPDDAILIQYNLDGGTWTTIGAFYGDAQFGGHMRQDADLNGVADPGGAFLTSTLTNYSFTFNGAGTNLNVRMVIDQTGGSEEIIFDNICVSGTAAQVGPTLANIEGTTIDYTEGDPATQVTNTLTISDPDDTNMESATVSICGGFVTGEDVLSFTASGGITGSYNAATGVLSLSGSASIADYQTVLRSVSYQNSNGSNPNNGQRQICFQVNDGDDNSNTVSRNIHVIETLNDPACLPYAESFETEGEGTRYNSNSFDDAPDCNFFIRTNTQPVCHNDPIGGIDGSFYWASEDVRGGTNGNVIGVVELAPVIATDYTALQAMVLLGVSNNAGGIRFEPADGILIQYNMDNGGWNTVGAFYGDGVVGGHMRQDADLNGTADPTGAILTSTLQDFTFSIPATGNSLQVRVVIDQLGGSEEILFDNIRVEGTFSGTGITITSQPTNQTACEGTTANFSVTATGTSLTYQWQVDTGSGFTDLANGGNVSGATSANLSLSNILSGMGGNQYRVVISSGGSTCIVQTTSNAASLSIDIASTPVSSVTASINPICAGQSTDLTASGGTDGTGSMIVWYDGPNGSGNQLGTGTGITVSPTTTTTYFVRREGTCNTTADASITVTVSPPLTPVISGLTSYCEGSGGTTLDAGAGFASYSWSPGGETTQTISALAGTYSVTVTDANGCSGTSANVVVSENSNPTPSISGLLEYCPGSGGTILDAGVGFVTYSWSPGGETTQSIAALAGSYSVTVTDANGCTGTSASVLVTEGTGIMPLISGPTEYCEGTGGVSLDAGPGFVSYSWSPGGETTQTITALAGTYTVTVTDASGCSGTSLNVVVTENANPTPTISGSTEYCEGTGGVSLDAGAGFVSYSWSPGGETTQTISALAGTYSVTVTDANGCSGTSANVVVSENSNPTPSISGLLAYCPGSGGTILDAGAGFASYSWSPGGETTQTISALAGSYSVTVTDVNGCTGTSASVVVIEGTGITPLISGPKEYCEGTGGTTLDAGAGFVSYSWSPGGETTQTITALSGTYSVTVTDASGCSGTSTNVVVTETASPSPVITGDSEYCEGTGGATLDAGAGFVSYSWSPGGETTQSITALAGTYFVTVSDASGCSGTSEGFKLVESPSPDILIEQDDLPDFCQGLVLLSADIQNEGDLLAPLSYVWSNGLGTDPTAPVQTNGSYSVTVTDARGCSAIENIVVNVSIEDITAAYTLIAKNGIDFNRSTLSSGGAAVTRNNRRARFFNQSVVSTFVKAPIIQKFGSSTVANEIVGTANLTLPGFKANNNPTNNNIVVGQGQTRTLNGSSYGRITVYKNATLIFNNPKVFIKDLLTFRNVSVEFSQPTELIVDKFIDLGNTNFFNPGGEQVNVYTEWEFITRWGSTVMANVFAKKNIEARPAFVNYPTQMMGTFISQMKIRSWKYVEWNANPNCDLDFTPGGSSYREPEIDIAAASDWNIYPNPTADIAVIELPENLETRVDIIVYDLNGRKMVETFAEPGLGHVKLDVSGPHFMNAIYVVQVVGEGINLSKRLSINK